MDAFDFPGKLMGTEEEFLPGEGVYAEGYKLYSCTTGGSAVGSDRKVSIKPAVITPALIRPGMLVYGMIEEIFEPVALVRLGPVKGGNVRQSPLEFMSVLHASRVRPGYVANIREWVRIGDLIKARVEEIKKGEVYLSIKDDNLGVIKAFCSRCRNAMVFKGKFLQCIVCGNVEKRKLSSGYGTTRL